MKKLEEDRSREEAMEEAPFFLIFFTRNN